MLTAKIKSNGFTIVELLIVIVVIAILAAISIAAYNGIQVRARDGGKVQKLNDISKAIEMYKVDKGYYPQVLDGTSGESPCGSQIENWGHCDRLKTLTDVLAPYSNVELLSLSSPNGALDTFYYTSQVADNYQTYGMYIRLEGSGGQNDGGFYPYLYELGQKPRFCMEKYTGNNASWRVHGSMCVGGN